MSTADLIYASPVVDNEPAWARDAGTLGVRVAAGDITGAASQLDHWASERGMTIGEIARVSRDHVEVVLARPNPT